MSNNRTDFTFWDARYDSETYFYGAEPNDFLRAQAGAIRPGGTVLCLAEGEGRNAVWLAQQGFAVTGVDGSARGLQKLQQLASKSGVQVTTIVADLADFAMGIAEWDAIVSVWCHLPSTLTADVHRRVVQALKPGGVLVLEAYTPRQLAFKTGGPQSVDMLMTVDQLQQELTGLQCDILHEIEREIHEGTGHTGRSAVVQVLARKEAT